MISCGQNIELVIDGLGSSGEGVGGMSGLRVFVERTLPSERVSARIIESKRNYARAELTQILSLAVDRVPAVCKYFDECGGCQIMHLRYDSQLAHKALKVSEAFKRIGGLNDVMVQPCVPSPLPFAYRNKVSFPVSGSAESLQIGLYAQGTHRVINVDACPVQTDQGNRALDAARRALNELAVTAYNEQTKSGLLRHILIRTAESTGETLVVLITTKADAKLLGAVARKIMAYDSAIKGVVNCVNTTKNNRILGQKFHLLAGADHVSEKLCGLSFQVSAQSFFQINAAQAANIYRDALKAAALDGTQIVLDAYCGVGTLSLLFARHAKKVLGVEIVEEAIRDARANAENNNIDNAHFICGSTESVIETIPRVDVALVNPPRKGCEGDVLHALAGKTKTILYISCNPSTLARDAAILNELGFKPEMVQPYDMFPQTMHVETLVKFVFTS